MSAPVVGVAAAPRTADILSASGAAGFQPARKKQTHRRRWLKRIGISTCVTAAIGTVALTIVWHTCPFPFQRLTRWPSSPRIVDRHGTELRARIGGDDQWRFPIPLEQISPRLREATIAIEDERFATHAGVDPIAIVRAAGQNIAEGRVVSGASTITMQICRMMDDRPRTWTTKAIESFRALQLDWAWPKDDILCCYLNIAPYGGNLRGAEAAARHYFGRSAANLSLAEAALLAGLPQSPARLRPDRHPHAARARRDAVLRRMAELGMISDEERERACAEPIVTLQRTSRMARRAPHAALLALSRRPGGGTCTIDLALQGEVERLTADHARTLVIGADAAVVVIETASGNVIAMIGSLDFTAQRDGQVNGATARRSPGSALKPFIYAAAFEDGRLSPEAIVHDIPIERAGWSPKNFAEGAFAGQLGAAEALRRSLNVPAILTAEGVGLTRCLGLIEAAGVRLPIDAARRAGLTATTGGIEVTLLDLTNAYATLGRGGIRQRARLMLDEPANPQRVLSENTCTALDDILSSRARTPRGGVAIESLPWFMWKTGTSSGQRDAWAVGHNGRFAVGVWIGQFNGASSPHLTGADSAEPLLATLFSHVLLRRREADPPPHQPIVVRRPLSPPAELSGPLKIVWPADGATFIATTGFATIQPRANRGDPLDWFLDGRLLNATDLTGFSVAPGAYELRCVSPTGEADAVRFRVRGA